MKRERVTLGNGVKIYPFTSADEIIDAAVDNPGILIAINAEKIINATDDTKRLIAGNIGYSDGAGSIFALRKHGYKGVVKVAGCELWLKIIERLAPEGKSFYLIGGKPDVIEETVAKLRNEYPGINIAGYRDGYFSVEETESVVDAVVNAEPDVVFLALGSPKQELLAGKMQERHKAIYQGLGGSFDVYTGHAKRAPAWWVDHNVEFLYRLIHQPSRISRQIFLLKFWWYVKCGKI